MLSYLKGKAHPLFFHFFILVTILISVQALDNTLCKKVTSCLKSNEDTCDRVKKICPVCLYKLNSGGYSCWDAGVDGCIQQNLAAVCSRQLQASKPKISSSSGTVTKANQDDDDSSGSWKLPVLIVGIILAVLLVAGIAYKFYKNKSDEEEYNKFVGSKANPPRSSSHDKGSLKLYSKEFVEGRDGIEEEEESKSMFFGGMENSSSKSKDKGNKEKHCTDDHYYHENITSIPKDSFFDLNCDFDDDLATSEVDTASDSSFATIHSKKSNNHTNQFHQAMHSNSDQSIATIQSDDDFFDIGTNSLISSETSSPSVYRKNTKDSSDYYDAYLQAASEIHPKSPKLDSKQRVAIPSKQKGIMRFTNHTDVTDKSTSTYNYGSHDSGASVCVESIANTSTASRFKEIHV